MADDGLGAVGKARSIVHRRSQQLGAGLLVFAGLMMAGFAAFRVSQGAVFIDYAFLAGGVVLVLVGIRALRLRIEVTADVVTVVNPFRTIKVPLEDVVDVSFRPIPRRLRPLPAITRRNGKTVVLWAVVGWPSQGRIATEPSEDGLDVVRNAIERARTQPHG